MEVRSLEHLATHEVIEEEGIMIMDNKNECLPKLVDRARNSEQTRGLECLCVNDECVGMVVRVMLGDPDGNHEERLECQHCMRCFRFPRIEWQEESGQEAAIPPDLRHWPEPKEWLFEVVEQSRGGNEEAKNILCEILGNQLKRWTIRKLKVSSQDRACAVQAVIVRVRQRIDQLRKPETFPGWFRRVAMDVSKQYWNPTQRRSKQKRPQPEQIGTKTISVGGQSHLVRIFGPRTAEEPRQNLLVPLTDSIVSNWSQDNRPKHSLQIDVRKALQQLPPRWVRALFLMHVEGFEAAEAGEILGCSEERIYRMVQRAKERLRVLLKPYARNSKDESVPRSYKARQAAILKRTIPADLPPRRCWAVIRLRMASPNSARRSQANGAHARLKS
jgi:RNA polymerase sigma factor (sigma-70 family)